MKKNIVVIITGGIAAYKALDVLRLLVKEDYDVTPVLTKSSLEFVTALSASVLCKKPALTDLFDINNEAEMNHIKVAQEADLIAIIPSTANFLSKYANGIADDLALTILTATTAPKIFFPAMNPQMYNNPIIQENISKLKKYDDIDIIEPDEGEMACGDIGIGRLADPENIFSHIKSRLNQPRMNQSRLDQAETKINKNKNHIIDHASLDYEEIFKEQSSSKTSEDDGPDDPLVDDPQVDHPTEDLPIEDFPLVGRKILVTAGPTVENIDKVRYISNRSSGKQGYHIANELAKKGAYVFLISGPTNLRAPENVNLIQTKSAEDMFKETAKILPVDVAILCAAVSDFTPTEEYDEKIKKNDDEILTLELKQTKDIAKFLGTHPSQRPTLLYGFAAETKKLIKYAKRKRISKNLDFILANKVGENMGFDVDDNKVTLIGENEEYDWEKSTKVKIAKKLTNHIIKQLNKFESSS